MSTVLEQRVDKDISDYVKTHNRSESIRYNNRNYCMHTNPTEDQKLQYNINHYYILSYFQNK